MMGVSQPLAALNLQPSTKALMPSGSGNIVQKRAELGFLTYETFDLDNISSSSENRVTLEAVGAIPAHHTPCGYTISHTS